MLELLIALALGLLVVVVYVAVFFAALVWGCKAVEEAGGDVGEYLQEVERRMYEMDAQIW